MHNFNRAGCLAGGHLFSCLVVFQFRKNLIEDAAIREAIQGRHSVEFTRFERHVIVNSTVIMYDKS